MTISGYVINEFNQYAFDTANSFGGLDPNPNGNLTHNDQYDAYRHALMSAELTELFGEAISKKLMDDHEASSPNPPSENNMDRWNNNAGREEYKKWKDAKDGGQTTDSLEKWIFDRVKEGKTINDLADPRQWNEPITNDLGKTFIRFGFGFGKYINGIEQSIANFFTTSTSAIQRFGAPLTLDLNGDGIHTVPLKTPPLLFDINANGIKISTGWIAPDDGLLVLDRNGNGVVDNGAELFGDSTPAYDAAGNPTSAKTADGFAARLKKTPMQMA